MQEPPARRLNALDAALAALLLLVMVGTTALTMSVSNGAAPASGPAAAR